jgi:predicted permease
MISLLLLRKIAQMFLGLVLGFILVRSGKVKASDSKILSMVAVYIVCPCVIILSYQVSFDGDMAKSILLSLGAAVLIHALLYLATAALKKPLRLNAVEQASAIYSNCLNLLIPVISSVLGKEWIIFTSMYIMVQTFMLWSHCRMLLSGERGVSFRNIFCSSNVLSVFAGLALLLLRIRIPPLIYEAMDTIGSTMGTICMITIGMLMGGADLKKAMRTPGVWKVNALRLVVYPLLVAAVLKYSGLAGLVPNGEKILLISLLAACTPTGTMVTAIAQVHGGDAEYASAINMTSTALCILTIPCIVWLYQI